MIILSRTFIQCKHEIGRREFTDDESEGLSSGGKWWEKWWGVYTMNSTLSFDEQFSTLFAFATQSMNGEKNWFAFALNVQCFLCFHSVHLKLQRSLDD